MAKVVIQSRPKTKFKNALSTIPTIAQPTIPTTNFIDALPTDESEYPCYAVWITAKQISDLVYNNGLIADPNFQRGKLILKTGAQRQSSHSAQRSQKHIQSIANDLVTRVTATDRFKAVIPPVHINLRTDEPGGLVYNEETMELNTRGRLYTIDGFHRILAIDQGVRVRNTLNPDRLVLAYLYNAPSSYEAYLFCLLNDRPMRVPSTRTAWVSAPYEWNAKRLAYEFAHKSRNLVIYDQTVSPVEKITNFETVRNGSPKNLSFCYFNFRVMVEAICPSKSNYFGITRTPDFNSFWIDYNKAMLSPVELDLLATYLAQYWDKLVSVRPELGFMDIAGRKNSRKQLPYLINKVTARALIWLGVLLLSSYSPKKANATFAERLLEVTTNQGARFAIFAPLEKLGYKVKVGNQKIDFFSTENPVWQDGIWIKDGFEERMIPLKAIINHIGGYAPNSVKARSTTAITPPPAKTIDRAEKNVVVSSALPGRFKSRDRS
jgi:hypothetical protein